MLLLGSITSPKTQVLNSNFLSLCIFLFSFSHCSHLLLASYASHRRLLSPLPLSLHVALNLSPHPLSSPLHFPPPAAAATATLASLSLSTCLFSDLHFLSETLFLFISCSFPLCLYLSPASLLLWNSICDLSPASARSPARLSYLFLFQLQLVVFLSPTLCLYLYLFLVFYLNYTFHPASLPPEL